MTEVGSGMSDVRPSQSAIAKNRRQTKIVVWSILLLIALGGIFALWKMLNNGRAWQVLLILAVGAFFTWRHYKQATTRH